MTIPLRRLSTDENAHHVLMMIAATLVWAGVSEKSEQSGVGVRSNKARLGESVVAGSRQ